ncbi:hypothetical protein [Streptomyces sp. NPDC059874]|uniref:hypothetical protein n=1 Tax=Streptomyces sp. NPDC059874 TaxID=3346983 RepID=UPI00364EB5BB
MAGWSMTVCLPGEARDRVHEAVATAMAPFGRLGEAEGELGLWEAWSIDGGVTYQGVLRGGHQVRPGHENDPRPVYEDPARGGDPVPGLCVGGPRGLPALEESRAAGERLAGRAWDLWHELARDLPPAEPCGGRVRSGDDHCGFGGEHSAYAGQELPGAFRTGKDALLAAHRGPRVGGEFLHLNHPVEDLARLGREEFVRRESAACLPHEEVLTLDGWWVEGGEGPVHAACPLPRFCEHAPPLAPGHAGVQAYLEALPPDTLLVNVHCRG